MNNLTGKRFGRLIVLERVGSTIHKKATWLCKCDCGNTKIVIGSNLISGGSISCGCLTREVSSEKNRAKLEGKTFGRLVVIEQAGRNKHGWVLWKCICSCGKEKIIASSTLIGGGVKSCGCLAKDNMEDRNKNHNPMKRSEVKEKISGKNHPNWQGGISFEPYCPKFNRDLRQRIRAFFNYECATCGKSTEKNKKGMHCHHVEYNKSACCDGKPVRFAALCSRCHGRTNNDRDRWESMLHRIIDEIYDGRSYFTKHEWEALNNA